MRFVFGEYKTDVFIDREIPCIEKIAAVANEYSGNAFFNILVVCDENTSRIADAMVADAAGNYGAIRARNLPRCVLKSGEKSKSWDSVQAILAAAQKAGVGRDGIFIGVGGGVIGDLCGFAASIYMRGCRFIMVSTTLLGMVDASIGGKTGIDLFGIKNLAGSFYPAEAVYMPLDCLSALTQPEWKSGLGELIKTAVLDGDDFLDELASIAVCSNAPAELYKNPLLLKFINRAVSFKAQIVSEDPKELGNKRALLNLGHTFAHALESSSDLGNISHGEAVAWGIVRSCELGYALGITPRSRAGKIIDLVRLFGYCCSAPHPLAANTGSFYKALKSDKKIKQDKMIFIVPDESSARPVFIETEKEKNILVKITKGDFVI